MTFSGALTLTDLNDFITPSQACIKPVEAEVVKLAPKGPASTQIEIDAAGQYHEFDIGSTKKKKLQKAEISLNDCLACSGCITSAESVLITAQSHIEVLNFLQSNPPQSSPEHCIPVLSISPQSLASLAAATPGNPTLAQTLRRIRKFCTETLGFRFVFDTTFARHLALREHVREYTERKSQKQDGSPLPMISSACPGWVCYAEKTHAEMLPFISQTKSPQQIMGTLVKRWMGAKWLKSPNQVYHVTVMPCYDKKLEASRKDFYNDIYSTRDVDCVLTTTELDLIMKEHGWDLSAKLDDMDDSSFFNDFETLIPELLMHPGTSSGSYLHTICQSLQTPTSILSTKYIRSSDYEEFVLKDTDTGNVIFKAAKCYGFRNLQNVVRKVGRDAGVNTARGAAAGRMMGGARKRLGASKAAPTEDSLPYDYVEVMACPSGCVNGGGQIRPTAVKPTESPNTVLPVGGVLDSGDALSAKWGDKAWTSKVEEAYWRTDELPTPPPSPAPTSSSEQDDAVPVRADRQRADADQCIDRILQDLLARNRTDERRLRDELFRTRYHAVESDTIGINVQW